MNIHGVSVNKNLLSSWKIFYGMHKRQFFGGKFLDANRSIPEIFLVILRICMDVEPSLRRSLSGGKPCCLFPIFLSSARGSIFRVIHGSGRCMAACPAKQIGGLSFH